MRTTIDGMEVHKYVGPVDLYAGLRVKPSFRPDFEPIDGLDSLGLDAPQESVRVGVVRVPGNMMERRVGGFGAGIADHTQEKAWVVAEMPDRRYVALAQLVPRLGYVPSPLLARE